MDKFYEVLDWSKLTSEVIKKRILQLRSAKYQEERKEYGQGAGTVGVIGAKSGFFMDDEVIEFDSIDNGYTYNDLSMYDVLLRGYDYYRKKFPEKSPTSTDFLLTLVDGTVINYFRTPLKSYDQIIENLYNCFDEYQEEWSNNIDAIRETFEQTQGKSSVISHIRELFPAFHYFCYNEVPDISKIKNLGFSMCSEWASVTNQLFSFLGFESYYVQNSMVSNNGIEGHAYNIVKTDEGYVLVDIINRNKYVFNSEKDAIDLMKGNKNITLNKGENNEVSYGSAVINKNKAF